MKYPIALDVEKAGGEYDVWRDGWMAPIYRVGKVKSYMYNILLLLQLCGYVRFESDADGRGHLYIFTFGIGSSNQRIIRYYAGSGGR